MQKSYNYKQKLDALKVRLVVIYHMGKNYYIYVTNVPKQILDTKDIAKLYGTRWMYSCFSKSQKTNIRLMLLIQRMSKCLKICLITSWW